MLQKIISNAEKHLMIFEIYLKVKDYPKLLKVSVEKHSKIIFKVLDLMLKVDREIVAITLCSKMV